MNSTKKLIALYSPVMGSGKTTIAEYLVANHGFTLVKFAGPLKDMMRVLLFEMGLDNDIIQRMVEGDLKEVPTAFLSGKTPRHAMQTLGTEWGRDSIGPHFWVDAALRRANQTIARGGRVVIDDLRFPNEYGAVTVHGGAITVRVVREGMQRYNPHPSEGLLCEYPFDYVLHNKGTIRDLCDTADLLLTN